MGFQWACCFATHCIYPTKAELQIFTRGCSRMKYSQDLPVH